jgi:hypothetical protein
MMIRAVKEASIGDERIDGGDGDGQIRGRTEGEPALLGAARVTHDNHYARN